MSPNSPAARAVARRLLARAGLPVGEGGDDADARVPGDPTAAIEQICRELGDELSRWFGPFGFHALLTRALAGSRAEHPALADVRVRATIECSLDGLAEAVRAHGADATLDGVAAVVASLVGLLGRLIGADLAVNLVSRAMMPPAPDAGPEVLGPAATRAARGAESGNAGGAEADS